MTKFGFYFCAILIIFLAGCSQNASTPFSTNGVLNSSSAKFEGDVRDPGSIAFFKNNVGDRVLFSIDQSDICLLYTSPSPRDAHESRMPSSA